MNIRGLKLFILFSVVGFITLGCAGPDGETYLSYSWVSSPVYFYDENPSTPSTVYNGVYFNTNEGSFYMEYTAWSGDYWYMYYTIEAKEGDLLIIPGDDVYFEITLYSSGPTLYERSEENAGIAPIEAPSYESERFVANESLTESGYTKLPLEGTEKIFKDGYQLTIEYGKLERK